MTSSHRALRRAALGTLLLAFSAHVRSLRAQEADHAIPILEPTTVVANRLPTPLRETGSAVTVLSGERLDAEQVFRLEEALTRVPGLFSESTGGQRGSISSLFLRGTATSQAHLRVDGVRLSDSTVATNKFFGNAVLDGIDRIEVLRGPQSALYGGESIGGVVSLQSQRGEGDPRSSLFVEGGSFGSLRGRASSMGTLDPGLSYALHLGWEQTRNDAQGTPELDHRQLSYALRLDYDLGDRATVGATFRGGHASFDDAFDGENFTDYQLISGYGNFSVSDHWETTFRLGVYQEAYDFGEPSTFATDAEKWSLSWENIVHPLGARDDSHFTSFGLLAERTDYAQDFSFPAERDQFGVHATHLWRPVEALSLTGGLRWEDFDDYGDEFTWRATAAYQIPHTDTTLRASFGTAFRTPNLIELNGGPFEVGNPALDPERSEGWDIGLTQGFGEHLSLHVTWFENEIEELIVDPFGAPPSNTAGKGNANGLEAGLEGTSPDERFRFGLAYTYLQRSLVGLPEHLIDAHVVWQLADRLRLGAGLSFVDDRHLGGDPLADYLLLRLFASLEINDQLSVHARIENATDERYEHAQFGGVPIAARRLAAFAGMTWRW